MGKKKRKRTQYVVVEGDGDPCPRCGQPTQIREHDAFREHLAQPLYYTRWFCCRNPKCKTFREFR
jgi:hypothetical protein